MKKRRVEEMERRKESGFTLIELMMVIAVIGILASVLIPKFGEFKTSAKITGVETNYRSAVVNISGMSATEDIDNKLDSIMDNVTNPITNQTGVSTSEPSSRSRTKAVYVFYTENSASDYDPSTKYNGAVIVYVHSNYSADVFACDDDGNVIEGLETTVER